MEIVQITLADTPYANALREQLERSGVRGVRLVGVPDPHLEGVIVVDSDALDLLPFPLPYAERTVLITRNDPEHLSRAWNAGVRSVVFSQDPLDTTVLAIMAADLRSPRGESRCPGAQAAASRMVRKGG